MSEPGEIRIRDAVPADVDAVLALWREAEADVSATDDAVSVGRLIAHPTSALLLAVRDARPVGTMIVAWDGWRGGIYRLAVAPRSRRQGVASVLVAEGERRLAALGCRRISILVLHEDDGAPGFWAAIGYTPDPRMGRWYRDVAGP